VLEVEAGNSPFGSVLVDSTGKVLKEDQNRTITEADVTQALGGLAPRTGASDQYLYRTTYYSAKIIPRW
jgi:hypothetical protein